MPKSFGVFSMTEKWRSIGGYEGYYEVSNMGRIKSLTRTVVFTWRGAPSSALIRERILKLVPDSDGHLTVFLAREGVKDTRRVHSLVAAAFLGPRPSDKGACHKDDEKSNNCVENLYYGTQQENMSDSVRNGKAPRGITHGKAVLDDNKVRKIRSLAGKLTIRDIGDMFGITHQAVHAVITRKTWCHVREAA
jgi:hypothetical protein